jgi:hypothetical protein
MKVKDVLSLLRKMEEEGKGHYPVRLEVEDLDDGEVIIIEEEVRSIYSVEGNYPVIIFSCITDDPE